MIYSPRIMHRPHTDSTASNQGENDHTPGGAHDAPRARMVHGGTFRSRTQAGEKKIKPKPPVALEAAAGGARRKPHCEKP